MELAIEERKRYEAAKHALSVRRYGACVETFNELAQRDHMPSAVALGEIYFRGGDGVKRDYEAARNWLERVDRFVYIASNTHKLGLIYYRGLGVDVDHVAAYRCFRLLAKDRIGFGLAMVGLMHKSREGVPFKPRFAQKCFRDSLQTNHLNLIERIGVRLAMLTNFGNLLGLRRA